MKAWPFLGALLLVLVAAPAMAQQPARSHHGALRRSIDCNACHTAAGWTVLREPLAFSHPRDAAFPLDGRHAGLSCSACHLGLRFAEPRAAAGDCAVCHVDVHQGGLDQVGVDLLFRVVRQRVIQDRGVEPVGFVRLGAHPLGGLPADEVVDLLRTLRLPHMRTAAPELMATTKAQRWEPAEAMRALRTLEWVDRHENLVVRGPSGTGKTHCEDGSTGPARAGGQVVSW